MLFMQTERTREALATEYHLLPLQGTSCYAAAAYGTVLHAHLQRQPSAEELAAARAACAALDAGAAALLHSPLGRRFAWQRGQGSE